MHFPDINGDGSIDASEILSAYNKLSSGEPSGLTAEQELLADANMDGSIDSVDSSLVMGFYAELSTGKYSNSTEGWTEYLNDVYMGRNGVI